MFCKPVTIDNVLSCHMNKQKVEDNQTCSGKELHKWEATTKKALLCVLPPTLESTQ